MSEGLQLIFVFYIIYLIMKKSKTTPEKPMPKVKAAQPIATAITKVTPKKPSPVKKTTKKSARRVSQTSCCDSGNNSL